MITISVDLGVRSYPIHIGSGLLSSLPEVLGSLHVEGEIGLISTSPVHKLYGNQVEDALRSADCKVTTALVPDGEKAKDLGIVMQIYDTLLAADLDRTSILVALGGGVIGDLTGYVAATLFRGISFIQIPTSLLAMVDASIGGKTGVNHSRGKNLIGVIHQPKAVLIDPECTHTLPRRELTAAYAEILKVGAIVDREFFLHLAAKSSTILDLEDIRPLEDAIVRACRIKAQVVSEDEYEGDRRRILNFGHTLGHALEATLGYGAIRHGEAVAMGMVGAGYLSVRYAGLTHDELQALTESLSAMDLPRLPPFDVNQVISYIHHDKKVRRGTLHFVLLEALGHAIVSTAVSEKDLHEVIILLQEHFK
ncbi:3-dehydroquinate synthase [Candidatus Neomarinimicrobiota bacterium]